MSADPSHMTPEEFRRAGRAMVDWIASYMERVRLPEAEGGFPVASRAAPGDVAAMLPASAPERGEPWDAIAADVERVVLPGVMHWQSPMFFGFFPCNTAGPAILADMLSAALNGQGMLWHTSPAYTEIETRALDWLAELLDLPARFRSGSGVGAGVIQGTASEAAFACMIAARERTRAAAGARFAVERLVAYASSQAHSSILKDALALGLPRENVRLIDVDDRFALRADLFERAVREDAGRGLIPFFACATVGTTSSTADDPVRAMGRTCREHGVWLHVDAAFSGVAAVCPEFRAPLDGLDTADSFNTNPHKWLLTTFDCSALWVADRRALIDALSVTPAYLRNAASDSGAVIDYRDWGLPLGRRFRAAKLWFTLRHYGREGLRAHIREHVRIAAVFESLVREDPRFEVVAPRTLSLVCFRLRGDDAGTRAIAERLNAAGDMYLTLTQLPLPDASGERRPAPVLRLAVGGVWTGEEHVRRAWALIRAQADRLAPG